MTSFLSRIGQPGEGEALVPGLDQGWDASVGLLSHGGDYGGEVGDAHLMQDVGVHQLSVAGVYWDSPVRAPLVQNKDDLLW